MYKEISQVKSVEEIGVILSNHSDDYFFNENELKSVKNKNIVKSLGARYLIKESILDYINLDENYKDIEIENEEHGKPIIGFTGKVKEKFKEMGVDNVQISISHSRNFISTLVVLEQNV